MPYEDGFAEAAPPPPEASFRAGSDLEVCPGADRASGVEPERDFSGFGEASGFAGDSGFAADSDFAAAPPPLVLLRLSVR